MRYERDTDDMVKVMWPLLMLDTMHKENCGTDTKSIHAVMEQKKYRYVNLTLSQLRL